MPEEKSKKEVGEVVHFFGKISVAVVKVTADSIKIGDTLKFEGHGADFEQKVESMEVEHQKVQEAKAGEEVGMKVEGKVKEGTKVYKLE